MARAAVQIFLGGLNDTGTNQADDQGLATGDVGSGQGAPTEGAGVGASRFGEAVPGLGDTAREAE